MTAGTVHFVVEGEFLTDTARRLWNEEGEPEKAMNILECLHDEKGGITKDQMMAVLEGRLKLVGDSDKGIGLKPDTYKGLTLKQVMAKMRKQTEEAEEDRDDLVQLAIGDTVIVGSHTGAREIPRRKSSKDRLSHFNVLEPGREFDDYPGDAAPPDRKPRKKQRVYKRRDDFGKNWGTAPKVVDEEREEEKREKAARAKARREVETASQDSITTDTGWLSPEGRFYPCGYAQHARVAWALGHTGSPTNHMVEIDGWIRMSVSGEDQNFFSSGYERGNFTEKQVELVKAYCGRTGQKLPFWLREEEP